MAGDYTRFTFDPTKNYAGVWDQQGRLRTDADGIEQWAIHDRGSRTAVMDLQGRHVVSGSTPDAFRIVLTPSNLTPLNAFTIGIGRMYVDGLQVENHGLAPLVYDAALGELRGTVAVPYNNQPYYPNPEPLVAVAAQTNLIYLDVWQREVTALEDPEIREIALGGPDTTTRLQTVWQVRFLPDVGPEVTCETPDDEIPGWLDIIRPSPGRLTTLAIAPPASDDPCILSPAGGYRGLENRLYRVEIHTPGPLDVAEFKWSRDNGSVVAGVEEITTDDVLTVTQVGHDLALRFQEGDWVEVLDEFTELQGAAGHMAQITVVDAANRRLTITPSIPPSFNFDPQSPERHTRVRRWDQQDRTNVRGLLTATAAPIAIEDGIQITFSTDPASGSPDFQVGDYWVFAARTADGSVEELDAAPPRGIHHHYSRLGLLTWDDDVNDATITDCRQVQQEESGIGILAVEALNPDGSLAPVLNDRLMSVARLAEGLLIECDAPLAPESVGRVPPPPLPPPPPPPFFLPDAVASKPTCTVTLDLPYPLGADDTFWNIAGTIVGFQPLILASMVAIQDRVIEWRPTAATYQWLRQRLFQELASVNVNRVLCHLTIKGNFIWRLDSEPEPTMYLDGNNFGRPDNNRIGLRFPTGDGQRGGDFEMWFWLYPLGLTLDVNVIGNVIEGSVRDSVGEAVEGIMVTLTNTGDGSTSDMTTIDQGRFSFGSLSSGSYRVGIDWDDISIFETLQVL